MDIFADILDDGYGYNRQNSEKLDDGYAMDYFDGVEHH